MSDVEFSELAARRKASRARGVTVALALMTAALAVARSARAQNPAPERGPMAAPVPDEVLARAAAADLETRLDAIASLQALGTPAAFQLVLVMLQRDLEPSVRAAAAVALGGSHDPAFGPALGYAAVADPDASVRATAAAARASVAPFEKRPKVAAAFSVLCPGCGYFYLGRPEQAVAYLASAAGLLTSGLVVFENSPIVASGSSTSHDSGRATPLLMAVQNLWFYGIYASYRDARLARGDHGARFPVAREDLPDLLAAPFNPRVLASPWVWGGLPVMLTAAVGASALMARFSSGSTLENTRKLSDPGGVRFFGRHFDTGPGFALGEAYNTSLYLPVGVGEEALFRGVIQAGLSETSLGLWGGWAVGSAIFGAAHTFNFIGGENGLRDTAFAVPYLIVTGSYLGFLYVRSNFSLLQGAAVHFWYDFLLATLDFYADPDHQPFVAHFATPF
ncbi:MAG TPA: CPBP family glutamic-type intramembrane protease [Polyangia bacterium]